MEVNGLMLFALLFFIGAMFYHFKIKTIYVDTNCDWCSKEMRITRDLFRSNRTKGIGNYCCEDCEIASNQKMIKCDWCGSKYEEDRKIYLKNQQNGLGNFCTGRCRRNDENTRHEKIVTKRRII
jgi:hypothetical protein